MGDKNVSHDLLATIDSLTMGVVVVDKDFRAELINSAFHDMWNTTDNDFAVGDHFRKVIDFNRNSGIYDTQGKDWEEYILDRLTEIARGNVRPREFVRADGLVVRYSVTNLSDSRRLISYFDVTKETKMESIADIADVRKTQLSEAIEALEDGFALFNSADELVICNAAFVDQFKDVPGIKSVMKPGTSYREMTMMLAKSGIVPGIEGKEEEFVEQLVEKRRSELGVEKTFKTHDGRWIKQRDILTPTGGIVGVRIDVTDVKENEEKIAKTSELLSATSQALPQGLLVIRDEKIEFFNQSMMSIFDFGTGSAELFAGQSLDDFLDGHLAHFVGTDQEAAKKRIKSNVSSGKNYSLEHQIESDKFIAIEGIAQENGSYLYIYTDITESKLARQQVEEREALLSLSASSLPQGMLVIENGKINHFNPKMLELHNLADADLYVGQDVREFLEHHFSNSYSEVTTASTDAILERIESGQSYTVERETKAGKLLKIEGIAHTSGIYIYTYTDITKEMAVQTEIATREALLNSVLSASESGILVTDGFGKLVTKNEKAMKLFNLDTDDARLIDSYKDLLAFQFRRNDYAMDLGNSTGIETLIENAIKLSKSALEKPKILHMSNGKVIRYRARELENGYIVHSYIDITHETKKEEELKTAKALAENAIIDVNKNQKIFEDFAKSNSDWFWKMDKDLKFSYFSETFESVSGVAPEKLLGKTRRETGIPGVDKALVEQHISDLENHKAFRDFEHSRTFEDGREVWLSISGNPIFDQNGEFEGYIGSGRDVTDRVTKQKELEFAKHETEKLLEIQSASADAMVQGLLFFQEGLLNYFNPKFLELVGGTPDDFKIGMSQDEALATMIRLGEFNSETDEQKYKKDINKKLDNQQSYSLVRTMRNGKILQVDSVIRENGGLVVAYSDITESKQREIELFDSKREAESAERAKSEFLANMSHEIRTPMNGVMGMAELLATTELDAKQKMFTDVIVKSGASLLTIINDILDFSKIDAGQLELDLAPFNMREAIEDVATLVSAKVAEKDLEMIVRVKPGLPNMVIGDVGRFRQIVTNLLGNAVKFTEKGHIYVNIDGEVADGNSLSLTCAVEDTGIGIPPEQCAQIFDKFSQVDTSATRKHEGTGLGLSISSSLVQLMGGQLKVESEVGKGSVFSFAVTLEVHEEERTRAVVIPSEMAGSRVLIIDDNEVNRSILTEQMQAWKFDSASAAGGAEGLDIIRAVVGNNMNLDLIILDYQMPGMSGGDVLEEIRNDPKLRHIPVIMLTSVDSSDANKRFTALGVDANLTKPTRSSLLLETIMQVIANSRESIKHFGKNAPQLDTAAESVEPAIQQELPASNQTDDSQSKGATGRLDVLVAEDNEVNQIVFKQILEEMNISYNIVENGRLALAAYRAAPPKMILMDVSMPEMNGKEATQAIRAFERETSLSRVPIVGVTAHALKGDMEDCIDAGMDDYLSKPVSPNKLMLKVQQWLKLDGSLEKQS